MDELTVSGKKYISSKRAAEISGYAKDYIGQLARLGKITGVRFGRAWYVEESSVLGHVSSENKGSEAVSTTSSPDRAPVKIPAHFYKTEAFPKTWSAIKYFDEDHELMPTLAKSPFTVASEIVPENTAHSEPLAEVNPDLEVETLKIKILRASVEPKSPITRVGSPVVFDIAAPSKMSSVSFKPSIKSPLTVREVNLVPTLTLAGGVALFVFFLSGLFLSSQVSYTPQNEVYTASVLLSVENVQGVVQGSPFIQAGVGALATFYRTITGSFFVFLKDGVNFIFH